METSCLLPALNERHFLCPALLHTTSYSSFPIHFSSTSPLEIPGHKGPTLSELHVTCSASASRSPISLVSEQSPEWTRLLTPGTSSSHCTLWITLLGRWGGESLLSSLPNPVIIPRRKFQRSVSFLKREMEPQSQKLFYRTSLPII